MQIDSARTFFKIFWYLFKDYWCSEEKWKARGLLAVVILLNMISIYLLLAVTSWYNEFYTILQNYSYQAFWQSIGKFTILALLIIILSVYALYLQQMLQIKWRTWMTKEYLHKWLHQQNYYKLQMNNSDTDNPDQRIQEDLNLFVNLTLTLGIGLFKQLMILVCFIVMLWILSGSFTFNLAGHSLTITGFMVWVTLIYSIFGTLMTNKIGHQLIGLNFTQQKVEADFRFSLVRLRENSEAIAFYHGEQPETDNFKIRFVKIIKNFRQIMQRQKILTGITVSYSQIAIILPILIAAPRYFGEMLSIGWLMQTLTAFGKVQDALSYFVNSYTDIAQWSSVIRRLSSFSLHMHDADTVHADVTFQKGDNLRAENLSISLPNNGKTILDNFSFNLAAGDNLIITGPSGCGKSTLLRTLAGIWPIASGKITMPKGSILFLPQRPYLPLGTLRQAIYYPSTVPSVDSIDLAHLLTLCGLKQFISQLETENDWSRILSLGEQQRLAFIRVLLQKPQWVFLDEATSSLDENAQTAMYSLLQQELPYTTVISVSHRPALTNYHQYVLTMGKDTPSLKPLQI